MVEAAGSKDGGLEIPAAGSIGPFIADFYCPAARLVIELDGSSHAHEDQAEYDERRQRWLESKGLRVLRFSADDPNGDYLEGVWDTIDLALSESPIKAPLRRAARDTSPRSGEESLGT